MKSIGSWLGVSFMVIAVAAAPVVVLAAGDSGAGKLIYDKKCASCHGKTGEGNPAIAKSLKVELRPLGSKEVQSKSDDELRKLIVEGTAKKKPVKGLTEEDLANVVAYLRTLAQK
jgi:mono/diheme cytochrome c family protein